MAAYCFLILAFTYITSTINAEILRLPCKNFANFSIIKPNAALQGSVIATLLFKSERECRFDCMLNSQCKSINREEQGDQTCELNNKTTEDRQDSATLVSKPGWTFQSTDYSYRLIGQRCQQENPCPEEVLCKDTCECPGYSCFPCSSDRTGLRCDRWKDCKGSKNGQEEYRTIHPKPNISEKVICWSGWIVIQRRRDSTFNFERNWKEYVEGFGSLEQSGYWIGLEKIHILTTGGKKTELKITLHGKEIHYKKFSVGSEAESYSLDISGYERNSSANTDELQYHDKMKFSTADQDNDLDSSNCASSHEGGWWYRGGSAHERCFLANLNRQTGAMWGNSQFPYTVSMMIRQT
eukprot:Seg1525.8 transcript_id=Seg1525.8/GoldUCD/mRNA.D3Y31 product=Tenascin-R protein_id=Seg1525.8/GoldUCD/D3Y31